MSGTKAAHFYFFNSSAVMYINLKSSALNSLIIFSRHSIRFSASSFMIVPQFFLDFVILFVFHVDSCRTRIYNIFDWQWFRLIRYACGVVERLF